MKGRRTRSLAAAAAVLLAAGLAAPVAGAADGTYTVVECDPLNRDNADAILEDASPYAARSFCGDPHNGYAIKIDNTGHAQHGGFGRVRWTTGSADLSIVAVDVRAKLRRDNGHASRLWIGDEKLNQVAGVATGGDGATAFKRYRWSAAGRGSSQFVAGLSCERPAGCRRSDAAKTWVRDVHLEVADHSDPVFTALDGTVIHGGWVRGNPNLRTQATDPDSGIARVATTVDGSPLVARKGLCIAIPGTSFAVGFRPCGTEILADARFDTARPPFHDGRISSPLARSTSQATEPVASARFESTTPHRRSSSPPFRTQMIRS